MYLQLLPEIPEDSKLRQEWNTLVQQMERPEIFYTYEWALAMQRAYGRVAQPLLVLAYEDGRLRGVAALATHPGRQDFSFLSATTADYCDFVSGPGDRKAVIENVLSELRGRPVRRIRLANLPANSSSATILSGLRRSLGIHVFSRPAYRCAQISLGSQNERERRKAGLFGKKIRRYLTALQREGPVTVDHLRIFG